MKVKRWRIRAIERTDSLGEDNKGGQGPTWAIEPRSE
jgi:hypothetical protein